MYFIWILFSIHCYLAYRWLAKRKLVSILGHPACRRYLILLLDWNVHSHLCGPMLIAQAQAPSTCAER